MTDKINIMLVDDSAVIRSVLRQLLTGHADFEIVAEAKDGQMALDKIAELPLDKKPHVVILDIQMPVMDGITALPKILELNKTTRVIIASTLSKTNAEISLKALELGAVDYLPKPSIIHEGKEAITNFAHELVEKARTHGNIALMRSYRTPTAAQPAPIAPKPVEQKPVSVPAPISKPAEVSNDPAKKTLQERIRDRMQAKSEQKAANPSAPIIDIPKPITSGIKTDWDSDENIKLSDRPINKVQAIAIGSSTGGPEALNKLFEGLRNTDLSRYPVFITQHMPPHFTKVLAENLCKHTGRRFKEAEHGEVVSSGICYVAPGNYHMTVERSGVNLVIKLNQDEPENFCRPAVDPMLRSLNNIYGKNLLVVILTGMGSDGSRGAKIVHDNGGTVFAQDKESSTVWGMPGATAKAGICKKVLPLTMLPNSITEALR